jgi:hypothetical protein
MLGVGLNITSSAVSGVSVSRGATFSNDYSLLLDGVGDYFDTNYSANDVFDGSYSVSVWVRPTDGRNGTQYIWGGGTSTDYIYVSIDALGRLVTFHVSNSDAAIVTSPAVFADGAQSAWTHVVLSVIGGGGSDTTYQFYVDGSAVTTTTLLAVSSVNHAAFDSGSNNLYIGGNNSSGILTGPLTGHIDEFSLHDGALTSGMVTAIYNSGVAIDLTQASGAYDVPHRMKLYYRFENNANDDGSAGSNGALAADALYSTAITPP